MCRVASNSKHYISVSLWPSKNYYYFMQKIETDGNWTQSNWNSWKMSQYKNSFKVIFPAFKVCNRWYRVLYRPETHIWFLICFNIDAWFMSPYFVIWPRREPNVFYLFYKEIVRAFYNDNENFTAAFPIMWFKSISNWLMYTLLYSGIFVYLRQTNRKLAHFRRRNLN